MRLELWVGLSLVLCLLGLAGCRCDDESVLARLEEKKGAVDRDTRQQPRAWSLAEIGAVFGLGDAVRTGKDSNALLSLDDDSKVKVRPETVLRFSDSPPQGGERGFDVETGEALLEVAKAGMLLRTSLGLARIEGRSHVLVKRTSLGVRFEVHVGRAVLESGDGKQTVVEAGQGIVVGVGQAVLERVELERDEPVAEHEPEPMAEPAEPEPVTGDVAAVVTGQGVSLKKPTDSVFSKLEPGAVQLPSGSTVKVQRGSLLELSRSGAKARLSGSGTYGIGGGDGQLVDLQAGSVALSGGSTRISVPGGSIVTAPGSGATVDALTRGTRVRVASEHVSVHGSRGVERVTAGQEATLGADGAIEIQGRGLAHADISVTAGEAFVVHDPKPPTAVRFLFASLCPEGGVIRTGSRGKAQFASGNESVALPFTAGQHQYGLYCLEGEGEAKTAAAQGSFTILHDSGTRPVPKKPPATAVEADGRTYTVMYQNQLPSVALRWSKAPQASGFSLIHRSAGGERQYQTPSAAYSFRSGALPEGRHTFYFQGGGKVSRQTTVHIRFDNAAPTASLQTPVSLGVGQGAQVTIAGMAQPGWSVEINGQKALLDGQQRFSQKAEMPKSERALAVRLTHPDRGTHIYVRRAAGIE